VAISFLGMSVILCPRFPPRSLIFVKPILLGDIQHQQLSAGRFMSCRLVLSLVEVRAVVGERTGNGASLASPHLPPDQGLDVSQIESIRLHICPAVPRPFPAANPRGALLFGRVEGRMGPM